MHKSGGLLAKLSFVSNKSEIRTNGRHKLQKHNLQHIRYRKEKLEKTEYLYEVVFVYILQYVLNIFNQNLASLTTECIIASKVIC